MPPLEKHSVRPRLPELVRGLGTGVRAGDRCGGGQIPEALQVLATHAMKVRYSNTNIWGTILV